MVSSKAKAVEPEIMTGNEEPVNDTGPMSYPDQAIPVGGRALANVQPGGSVTQVRPGAVGFFPDDREEDGSLGMAPDEIRPPMLQFSGKSGKIIQSIYPDDELATFKMVILSRMTDTRVRWDPDELGRVTCASKDSWQPDDPERAMQIGADPSSCEACRFSKFGKDEDGNATKPACTRYINLAVAPVEADPVPYLFSAKSTSLKLIDKLLQIVEMRRRKEHRKGYSYIVGLQRGDHIQKGKQDYYKMDARILPEPVPAEYMDSLSELWHLMRGAPIDIIGAQTEAGPADATEETS